MHQQRSIPPRQGLYDPAHEHDACGVGFVVNIKGVRSHDILQKGLEVLDNLTHRGACGCDPRTGDGAGVLMQIPHEFLAREAAQLGFTLPAPGEYGVGQVFLPLDPERRKAAEAVVERVVREEGQRLLGWRTVPVVESACGDIARLGLPAVRQVFIGRGEGIADAEALERKLYVIRKAITGASASMPLEEGELFYFCSLSAATVVYKGQLISTQIPQFYPDLRDPEVKTALAMVHQRFSTNTFPSWDRAHPYRFLSHNGEINTLRGNINWMAARQGQFASPLFGDDMQKLLPIIEASGSDSSTFDNCLELLVRTGRSLPHAVMMMIPEAWQNDELMSAGKRAFYEYHSSLMEPWDGPASITFTDGRRIGAVLDRNGLRPSRYTVTKDGMVVMASEAGVLDIPPAQVERKGRLQPGRMFFIDTVEGRIVEDEEIKATMAAHQPYRQWLDENLSDLDLLPEPPNAPAISSFEAEDLPRQQQAFGYTTEELKMILAPMAVNGQEPVGSMGTDTPLAVLSDKSPLLFNYFKQLFAQVTNPPIDPIREEMVTSAITTIGSEQNLFEETPAHCRQLKLWRPVITNVELEKIKRLNRPGLRTVTLSTLYRAADGEAGLRGALERLCRSASEAIADGATIIVLSDRGVDREHAPIPSLLATGAVHHHLIREGTRTRAGLVVESGEPREAQHFCLLVGYGAGAVNPYLAYATMAGMIDEGILKDVDEESAVEHFNKSVVKSLIKIASKMGISTVQSYRGAQIFEAIGLNQEVIDRYFTWTASRVGGVGLEAIARETANRHRRAFEIMPNLDHQLEAGGQYQWRRRGEHHMYNPNTIAKLQHAVRAGNYKMFKEYTRLVDDHSRSLATLRSLLKFKFDRSPVPIEEVEPASEIVKRFKTGAMSFGSIGKEAHENLAIAMNRIGGKSNTGEGGEDPARFVRDANGDWRRSAIKQVASARFGVTSWYLVNADELQIKMAQGAKPGEGGQLPGHKVDDFIAKIRYSTPGVGLISPPPHHDIYSIEDLAQLIHDLKNSNRRARVSVKLVAEVGVGTIAAGVAKAKADVVLISGHDGGTGASPLTSIKHAGVPWELGLGRDPANPGDERFARAHPRRDRRPAQDRARRDDRGAARRRGVRLRERGAGGLGMHHDARVPSQHLPGGRRDPGSGAAQEVRGQARARGEPDDVHRGGDARVHGAVGVPQRGRDGGARRVSRRQRGDPALEGAQHRPEPHPASPAGRPRRAAALRRAAGPWDRARARSATTGAVRGRARPSQAGRDQSADPQREPHRRHDSLLRGLAPLRRGRTAALHDQNKSQGIGGTELRRVAGLGRGALPGGRRQRLLRQGTVGRLYHRAAAARGDVQGRREHHHR